MSSNLPLPEWEYLPGGWPQREASGVGWEHPSIAQVMVGALPDFIRVVGSNAPLGIYPLAPGARSRADGVLRAGARGLPGRRGRAAARHRGHPSHGETA
jgi:hypothetical protein